ncbi:uncharacterized protein LOC103314149 [Tribolium castaneum]|uniref:uncharacterized protein LOC103314149 n=1 Tax=Tribolium castaneum TaxID=7070 RepID=UPI0030FE031E
MGDNLLVNEKPESASIRYTISITTAKAPQVLALAYAKRAESLFAFHKYDECLADIERALVLSCPHIVNLELNSGVLGSGLYPFCSLFNHSCFFNVDYVHYGATIVLRAIHPIKKGSSALLATESNSGMPPNACEKN